MAQNIKLLFTRDVSLALGENWNYWSNDVLRNCLGSGFTQLLHFTGRTVEAYRFPNELAVVRNQFIKWGPDHDFFSPIILHKYLELVAETRKLFKEEIKISDPQVIVRYFKLMEEIFPHYMACFLITSNWREHFEEQWGNRAQDVLDRLTQCRVKSEGLIENADAWWRNIILLAIKNHNIDKKYVRFVTTKEIERFIANGIGLPIKEIRKRASGYILFDKELVVGKSINKFFSEKRLISINLPAELEKGQLRGVVASPGGVITGQVQVVLNNDEISSFQEGMILITTMTTPYFVSAMKRAAAIITDEGGITCHAAIVAREMKKPCVIGTKIATKVFKNGDSVEVDATKGVVKKV